MSSLYKTDKATKIGKGQHLPAGSLADADLLAAIQRYRRSVAGNYKALLPDEIAERLQDGPMHVSPKIDGELWTLVLDGGEAVLVNPRGRLLVGEVPLLVEAKQAAKKVSTRTVLAGELWAEKADKQAGRSRVGDVSASMSAESAGADRLRFAAFDLLEGDDLNPGGGLPTYSERYAALEKILGAGTLVCPIMTVETKTAAGVSDLYAKWVESKQYEGVVVRTLHRTIKVKPSFTIDAVIIGYTLREDDPEMVRSLALALMRPDGHLHYVTNCGNMNKDTRREFKKLLSGQEVLSNWRLSSSAGALYRFVRPETVIEIKATDVQSEDSTGRPIMTMSLNYEAEQGFQAVRKQPCAALLYPIFVRIRDDKQVNPSDIRIEQVQERTHVEETEVDAQRMELPKSEVLRREVYTKTTKGKLAVRKLSLWKTNKDQVDLRFPAFVVHFTDYSAGRKDPLKREVRLAPSLEIATEIADGMIADNIKRGWVQE